MAIKTLDCVECGASVLYGRLSCPSCGALLASVAGSHRAAFRIVESQPDASGGAKAATELPLLGPEPEQAPAPVLVQAHVRARPRITPRRPRIVQTSIAALEPPVATEPIVAEPLETPIDSPAAAPGVAPAPPQVAAQPPVAEPSEAGSGFFAARPVGESAARTPWAPMREPAPTLRARPYQRHVSYDTEVENPVDASRLPGAYLPPAGPAATEAAAAPRWPSASITGANAMVAATAIPRSEPVPAVSTRRAVDAATFVEIAGWFGIVGATMSLLGFLLPWSVSVIGARGVGGYFNGWGLASPTHAIVFVGLLVVLGLGVMRTRVPAWLGTGVLGLVFGGLLAGLVWPYIVGPLGADVGVTVTALGGLALVIGGALASWATRHAATDPRV